jgi:hypothetical protein
VIANRMTAGLAGVLLATTLIVAPVLAAGASSPGTPAPAAAASTVLCDTQWTASRTNRSIAALRAAGDCEVDRRLNTIANLRTAIDAAARLTSGHKSSLTAILDSSESGLHALRSKIDADTTLATLGPDTHAIFADYRIYALVVRQAALVRADDAITATAGRLTDGATKILAAITQAQANGKDVTVATTQLAATQAAIAAALSQVDGDAAAVLALTPEGWNAGTAGPVLTAARSSIAAARADLATALADGKAAIASLK